jgi:hypothetical protein
MFRPDDIENFNAAVKVWANDVRLEAIDDLDTLGVIHRANSKSPIPLKQAVKTAQSKRNGITYRVAFKIPRHSVFVHKGVGRDTPISMVGQTRRKAKPWLNPAIKRNMHQLEEIVQGHTGQMVLNAIIIR